jgi:hypothetical protein
MERDLGLGRLLFEDLATISEAMAERLGWLIAGASEREFMHGAPLGEYYDCDDVLSDLQYLADNSKTLADCVAGWRKEPASGEESQRPEYGILDRPSVREFWYRWCPEADYGRVSEDRPFDQGLRLMLSLADDSPAWNRDFESRTHKFDDRVPVDNEPPSRDARED